MQINFAVPAHIIFNYQRDTEHPENPIPIPPHPNNSFKSKSLSIPLKQSVQILCKFQLSFAALTFFLPPTQNYLKTLCTIKSACFHVWEYLCIWHSMLICVLLTAHALFLCIWPSTPAFRDMCFSDSKQPANKTATIAIWIWIDSINDLFPRTVCPFLFLSTSL